MRWLAIFFLLGAPLLAQEAVPLKTYRRPVIAWVPPYNLARSKAHLRDIPEPAAALTHLALQFWIPAADGSIHLVGKFDPLNDAVVEEWRDWCHAHGIRALLCVYNGSEKWDWGLARDAFAAHREEFTRALLAEVDRLGLDGADLDLEGDGAFDGDQPSYIAFVGGLSRELHARGRQLFVESFPYLWNAPNQHWWPELFPLVEGVSAMGYEDTGAQSEGWRAYAALVAAAGAQAGKLLIGIPTHLDQWQGNTVAEHLQWIMQHEGPGVALWEAQLRAPAWRDPGPWKLLEQIHGTAAPP